MEIIKKDHSINGLEDDIDQLTIRLLSLRQPLGIDLRSIMAAAKMATDLERIADYASNIAMHIPGLNNVAIEKGIGQIVAMARVAQGMLGDVLDAYRNSDLQKAILAWHRDDQIDRIFPELLSGITDFMKSNPESVRPCTSLIFVARSLERIGDHITNVAEQVYYIRKGEIYRGAAPAPENRHD